MVARVGIRALQQNASAVVRRAASGEIIEITARGRPVARLVPLGESRLGDLLRAGAARPARRSLAELPPPAPLPGGTPPLGDLLAEGRSDER